ncbi:hypothetical protein C8F01DRAFT_1373456 [Mycena amicta]|nr:hypothetical protein C8F01DRAFT_1373456 [Mycena amicta]
MSSDDEPRFPLEMEREIFLTTALLYPSTIPPLRRVAHRVLIWVEPVLYRILHISDNPLDVAQLAAASSKPPAFLAQAVRCVVLHNGRNNDAAHRTLSRCTGVTSLAGHWDTYAPELLPILSAMPVQRLTGSMTAFIDGFKLWHGDRIAHSIFRALTHLEIFEGLQTPSGLVIVGVLPSLPCLTHLAISLVERLDVIGERLEIVLKNCHHLNVVVVLVCYLASTSEGILAALQAAIGEIPECLRDPRFVVKLGEHTRRWYDGVLDQPNYWTVAEDFVARKQRGEVDANNFWAESRV